jgi:hypothetical protein
MCKSRLAACLPTCIPTIQSSKRVGGGLGAEWLQTTKLFHKVLRGKPCDNRVTELVAPRSRLEPGTYGLTESQARQKPL